MSGLAPERRTYAVVWSVSGVTRTGRLEAHADRFELDDRAERITVRFAELAAAGIARTNGERIRGLPVLVLQPRHDETVRIASLEGAGVLHELAGHVERAGLLVHG